MNIDRPGFLFQQRGQATIEYTLVLIVSVMVILGSLYQLNSAFKKFADNYFGEYWACLLETGELPSFGGSAVGECDASFEEFSLENGRPLVGGGVGSAGNSGEGSGGNSSGGSSSGGGSSDGAFIASSPGIEGGSFGRQNSNRFRVDKPSDGNGDGNSGDSNGIMGGGVTDLSGYQSGAVIRIPLRRVSGYDAYDENDEKTKNDKKGKTSAVSTGEAQKSGPKLFKVERTIAADIAEADNGEITFGAYLRYLIIIAIVIAILLFIGSQVMQVSKSMD